MKSYLLSTLLPELELRDEGAFARAHHHPWLLREPTHWHPTDPGAATLLVSAATVTLGDGVPLAMALEPARPHTQEVTLGRSAACDLDLSEGTLSQVHCVFVQEGERWTVRDAGSTNGTWVDGGRLADGERIALADGMRIQAAQVLLTFHTSTGLWRRLEAEALRHWSP